MAERTVSSLCEDAREHLQNLRVDEGEAAAREALDLDPTSDDALALLGIALCRKGRTVEAIEALGQAVALNPANVTARSNLATARHQAGHLEAARAEWQAVLELDPDNTKAHSALAVVEWEMQQAANQPPAAGAHVVSPLPQPDIRDTAPQAAMPGCEALRHDLAGNPIVAPTSPQPQPAQGASSGHASATIIHYPQTAPSPDTRSDARAAGASGKVASGDYDPGGWSLDAIRAILMSPTEFMASQRSHYGLGRPVVFALINSLIVSVAIMLFALIRMAPALGSSEMRGSVPAVEAEVVGGIVGVSIGILIGIVAQFVMAALIHLLVRVFGGREPYGGTYRALVYASVAGHAAYIVAAGLAMVHPILFLPACILFAAGAVWSVVLAVIGISVIHMISGTAAFGAVFLVLVALFAIMLGFALTITQLALFGCVPSPWRHVADGAVPIGIGLIGRSRISRFGFAERNP